MATEPKGKGKRGRPKGRKDSVPMTDERRAKLRANANAPKVKLPPDMRAALSDAKGKLAKALSAHGVPHLVRIIESGPQDELFQWAMDFAADRGGMPRRREEQIDALDMPPMVISFSNFKPSTD